MYKVAVLMSTYNGEKYLREQIDSILAQKDVEVTLYVRDDGSSDGTIEIIKSYWKSNKNIRLNIGENLGVGNSFMQLVCDAGDEYDYYAFADQDDVWLPEKLNRGIDKVSSYETPSCYCSNQTLVDDKGKTIRERHSERISTGYLDVLNNNLVTGCTMIWNKALQNDLIEEKHIPSSELLQKRIHDVWVAMVASTIGVVIYDDKSFIHYRQHENNVVGVRRTKLISEWRKKINNPSLRNGRSFLAREVLEKYSDLIQSQEIKETLSLYAYYNKNKSYKRRLIRYGNVSTYSGEGSWQVNVKILFNLI